jgi:quercetin dioxygenase-like cupin family protein
MTLKHAQPLEVIALGPNDSSPNKPVSISLLRTPRLQLLRLVLAGGQRVPEHHVAGEITIQCVSGEADIEMSGNVCRLPAGTLVMLPGGLPHAVKAHEDAVLLVTVLHC